MNIKSESPWSVDNLEEFIFYCCPECDEKNCDRELFLQHAFDNHPHCQEYLQIFQVKEEPVDTKHEFLLEDENNDVYDLPEIEPVDEENIPKEENDFSTTEIINQNAEYQEERKVVKKKKYKTNKVHECSWCDDVFDNIKHNKK